MNDQDRQNIKFIRNLAPEALEQWLSALNEFGDISEIEYANQLLWAARNQIEIELLELFDVTAEEDVSAAAEYLQRFRL